MVNSDSRSQWSRYWEAMAGLMQGDFAHGMRRPPKQVPYGTFAHGMRALPPGIHYVDVNDPEDFRRWLRANRDASS